MSETRPLQFLEWDTGKRKLRYLFIRSPCSFRLCHGHQAEDNMIPLFLGADVVAHTGIRTENHPKLHAKFAKKGFAAKLNFGADFKFERLRLHSGGNSLWFYSIQGVFRVAFDMYSREEQLTVIESLQELWKTRVTDGPLSKDYSMKKCLGNAEHLEQKLRCADGSETQPELCGLSSDFLCEPQRVPRPVNAAVTGEHNYCLTEHCDPSVSHSQEGLDDALVLQKIKSLLDVSTNTIVDVNDQLRTTVLMLLDVIGLVISGQHCLDKMALSIVHLLDSACNVFAKDSLQKESASVYDNTLLFEVSSWLGNRFQSENECISQQVEEFKRIHIDRISDLPPAEELVAALFPKAMQVLLLNWMGLAGEASGPKLQSEYPILLLILEFANRNLITGVAHVLYSTLICK
ncbi:hypothetical protein FKM82_005049 [Ascaphus truei]|uniref:uncharacterized protein LOC142464764 n=1 Tax=Ascaphus truei TaxID=8439 RepID=UPI003F5A2CF1